MRSKSCLFMMLFFLIIKVIASATEPVSSPEHSLKLTAPRKKKKNQHKLMPCFGPERSLEDFFKHYSGTDRLCLCCYCYFCCSSFLYSSGTQWMIEWAYEWISEWAFKWDRLLFSPGLPDEWATKNSGNQMQSLCHICAFCWELQSNIRNTVTKHENFY